MSEIKDRLKSFRDKIGLNKVEMAEKLKVTHTAYNNYESGITRLNVENFHILSGMGCDLNWLITGESSPEPTKTQEKPPESTRTDIIQEECASLSKELTTEKIKYAELKGAYNELEKRYKELCHDHRHYIESHQDKELIALETAKATDTNPNTNVSGVP